MMSTPTPPTGGGLVAKLGGPRNAAIVGAGGTVALVALLALRKNKAAGTDGTVTTVTGDSAFDSGPYDMWQQWQDEYEQLQQQIDANGGSNAATGPGSPTPPTKTPRPAPIPKPPVPTPAPKPRKPPTKPKAPGSWVTVKHGDTLSEIAQRSHISMATLKKLNPTYWTNKKYQDGNRIWAGDRVRVK